MPPAFVQGVGFSNGGSTNTGVGAFSSNNTAGNLLIVQVRSQVGGVNTCTDTLGNTYTKFYDNTVSGSSQFMTSFYCLNCRGGANTVTVTEGTGFIRVAIGEWSGVSAIATVEGPATFATGIGATSTTGNVTTTGTDLLIALGQEITSNFASAPTVNNGFTVRVGDAGLNDVTIADLTAAAGTYNASFTYTGSATWGAGLIAFKNPVIVNTLLSGDGPMISAIFPVLMARMRIAAAIKNRKK
jgi:hypothetical protein